MPRPWRLCEGSTEGDQAGRLIAGPKGPVLFSVAPSEPMGLRSTGPR
jgi:hypothetical protein